MHTCSLSVAPNPLASLDSLSPCLFRSHLGPRTEHISLSPPEPSTHLVPPKVAPAFPSFFRSFFFFFFFLHSVFVSFPLLPHLFIPRTSTSPFTFFSTAVIFHLSAHTGLHFLCLPSPISASLSLFISSGVTLSIPREYFSSLHPSSSCSLFSSSLPCCLKALDPFDLSCQVFGFLSYLWRYIVCVHAVQSSLLMAECKLALLHRVYVCGHVWWFVRSSTGSHGRRVSPPPPLDATTPHSEVAQQKRCLDTHPSLISSSISQSQPATLILPLHFIKFILLHANISLITITAKSLMCERFLSHNISTSIWRCKIWRVLASLWPRREEVSLSVLHLLLLLLQQLNNL